MTKIWYPVKIQFLSFACEDMTVVMATSVSANGKRESQHLAICVYIINRILHARAWIRILSSSVQLDISRVSAYLGSFTFPSCKTTAMECTKKVCCMCKRVTQIRCIGFVAVLIAVSLMRASVLALGNSIYY